MNGKMEPVASEDVRQRSRPIDMALDTLRRRIRWYVLIQGLFLALIWVCASFWIALLLDYGPVWIGMAEMGRELRGVLLLVITVVLAIILYRWVFLRVRKRIHAQSLALLLERRFPELDDALITVVQGPGTNNIDVANVDGSVDEKEAAWRRHGQMLDEAQRKAESTLRDTPLAAVFNFRPIIIAGLVACLLSASVIWFAIGNRESFATGIRRVYLLDANQWPRDCRIELVGLKVKHAAPIQGIPAMNSIRGFSQQRVVIGKASSVSLLVRAELPNSENPDRRLPRVCELVYKTASGNRGRLPMSKVGGASEGYQTYALDGELLESVVEDIQFYVRGDDHRIGPFEIVTVPAPILTRTSVDCVFPDYLVDEPSSRYTPRTIPVTRGMKLPIGTKARIVAEANRPLQTVYILDDKGGIVRKLDVGEEPAQSLVVPLQVIEEVVDTSIVLQDIDGVFSRSASRIRIDAEQDKPPHITSRLSGIGTAVTPQARIPVIAEISDKNGISDVWIELSTPSTDTLSLEQTRPVGSSFRSEVDLRQLRISGELTADLPVQPPGEIALTIVAQDFFDLQGGRNIGAGSQHTLEVVTADRLLRILERDEADQRLRLEQILGEMTDARDYVARSRTSIRNAGAGFEPGDETPESDGEDALQDWELRQLFAQRALLQTRKSMQEISGVATMFEEIRLQLINNRIDVEDRLKRLDEDVVRPLATIAGKSLPLLEDSLMATDELYRDIPDLLDGDEAVLARLTDQIDEQSLQALAAAESVLDEIRSVLDSLLKFETQNELLDIVRRMLEQQQVLKDRTEAVRNREAFDDIFRK